MSGTGDKDGLDRFLPLLRGIIAPMIDLDPVLSRWLGTTPWDTPLPGWDRSCVGSALQSLVCSHRLSLTAYEPPDEEWIVVRNGEAAAITSALFPLSFVTPGLVWALRELLPQLILVPLASTVAVDYRATAEVLRHTLLRFGWTNDFSPAGFCVSDLLVESVQPA
ncbi:hypothetical protein GCM10023317_81420 [Actinopolymorpha pittospori]